MRSKIIQHISHLQISYAEKLDREEILEVLNDIRRRELACGHPLPEVVDLREVRENLVSHQDEMALVRAREELQMDGRGRVIAFVVATDDQFENTMGYMSALATRSKDFRVAQFFSLQDAEAWVLQRGYYQKEN